MFAMHTKRCGVSAVALAVALLAAGCSRDSGRETSSRSGDSFAASYARITSDLSARSQEIKTRSSEAKGGDVDKVLGVYERIKASSEQAQRDLRSLEAPPAVSAELARLVSLLGEQTDLLTKLITAARAEDRTALSAALSDLLKLTTEFDTARSQLERAIATCGAECA